MTFLEQTALGEYIESSGLYLDDFRVGMVVNHRPGRTLTEADNTWITLLTMNQHPLHINADFAHDSEFDQVVVNSAVTFAIVNGMTVHTMSARAVANLGWDNVRLTSPVFVGDTLYARSRVMSVRPSKSRAQQGIVKIETTASKADGTEVMSYERTFLVPSRLQTSTLEYSEQARSNEVLVIRGQELLTILPMTEAINVLEVAFRAFGASQERIPARSLLQLGEDESCTQLVFGAACLPGIATVGAKISSIAPGNKALGLPTINGLMTLFDSKTGSILAVMEGASLTALRTGAVSGLATRYLARSDSQTVAMIGAGAQARTQIAAICAVRSINEVFLHSRTRVGAEQLATWIQNQGWQLRVKVFDSVIDAVRDADIVCTATSTSSADPFLPLEAIRPGTHINAVGGTHEGACEVDPSIVLKAYTVVETRDAAVAEGGEIREAMRQAACMSDNLVELGHLIAGKVPARTSTEQITLFKSVGLAIEDTAVAIAIYEKAMQLSVGKGVSL